MNVFSNAGVKKIEALRQVVMWDGGRIFALSLWKREVKGRKLEGTAKAGLFWRRSIGGISPMKCGLEWIKIKRFFTKWIMHRAGGRK